MPESNINFAKVAANPTLNTWSQAYNAGKLFAVLSLEKKPSEAPVEEQETTEDKDFLATIGKGILDTLENEFFTLETKELESIKNAILITAHKIPDNIKASFVITACVKNVLYVFILGGGKIYLKRGTNFGPILQSSASEETPIKAASGFIQEDDLVALETKQFSDIIPSEKLVSVIDNLPPDEIVETLAPIVHGHEQGGAAAIIASFKDVPSEEVAENVGAKQEETAPEDKTLEEEIQEIPVKTPSSPIESIITLSKNLLNKIGLKSPANFNHSKKMYLSIAVIVLIILVVSIIFAVNKQNEAKIKAMFNETYPQAEKKYEEGQGLIELNQNLARDSFYASQKIVKDNLDKFGEGSNEQKQLLELLDKIEKAIKQTSGINEVNAKEASIDSSDFLQFVSDSKAIAFGQNDEAIYSIDKDGIYSTTKGKDDTKEAIENDGDWQNPIAIIPYLSNVYVLDEEDGILKFVGGSSGFGKTNYFADSRPDLSSAQSMAIDGSIWILLSDGSILKYTRGEADDFQVSGLDSSISNSSKIYTTNDLDNVYILDGGNSRVIVFDKEGNYKAQYTSDVLSSAKEAEVLESGQEILILSGGKIYEIELK